MPEDLTRHCVGLFCHFYITWWIKSKVFNHCYTTSHHLKPHLQLQAWSRTGRRSGRVPCEWHWPAHWVFPWTKEAAGNTCDVMQERLTGRSDCVFLHFYLWGIPMITLSTPLWLEMSMIVLRAGMRDSHPSRPNRFSEDHFLWRNSSNLWTRGGAAASHWARAASLPPPQTHRNPNFPHALNAFLGDYRGVLRKRRTDLVDRIIRPKRVLFSSRLNFMIPGVSNFSLIHWHCCTSLMNMNSTPMCWQ